MIHTADPRSTLSRHLVAKQISGGKHDKRAYPGLTTLGGKVNFKSASADGVIVCTYALPVHQGLTLDGPAKPTYLVHLVLGGQVELRWPGGTLQATPGRVGFQLHRHPLSLTAPSVASGILAWIPASTLSRKPGRSAQKRNSGPESTTHPGLNGAPDSLENRLLCECLANVASLVNRNSPPDRLNRAAQLLRILLVESADVNIGPAPQTAAPSVPWYVTVAERYAVERLADSLTMGTLARAAGVSARTLQDGFQKFRGYSPMQYLREQRMLAVRRELMAPTGNTSVTDIALKWGMNHLGRFSAYYASQFGERPSETLRMARLGTLAYGRGTASTSTH